MIEANDIIYRKAAVNNDTSSNGGAATASALSTANNSFLPATPNSIRTAGGLQWRKTFVHFATAENTQALDVRLRVSDDLDDIDSVVFIESDFDDTQADIAGTERYYGQGTLDSGVSIGATSIDVLTKGAALDIFQASDYLYIVEGGTYEYVQMSASAASYAGDVATLALATGLANNYTTAAKVSSVYMAGDVQAAVSNWVETTAAGTYDQVTYPPVLDGRSTVYDSWTATVTSTSPLTFAVSGANTGSVGNWVTSSDFTPTNPAFGAPYFSLDKDGIGGTWAINDTITWVTSPNMIAVFVAHNVPAATPSQSAEAYALTVDCESAG